MVQGAGFSQEMVAAAAAAAGLRGLARFRAPGFGARERAARLAFAMHAALVRPDVPEIERATRVAETLAEILGDDSRSGAPRIGARAPRTVRLARAFLHDALADKITLDDLATHAGLDKFHLVRAFRAEVGLPP